VSAGKTSFDFEDRPKLIKPFTEKKIMMIASGSQHSLALSDDGYVWAWGESLRHVEYWPLLILRFVR
jgi:alpha-tubulin suppressor-like RCC1 family protein